MPLGFITLLSEKGGRCDENKTQTDILFFAIVTVVIVLFFFLSVFGFS